jgi:hypothetical protein
MLPTAIWTMSEKRIYRGAHMSNKKHRDAYPATPPYV